MQAIKEKIRENKIIVGDSSSLGLSMMKKKKKQKRHLREILHAQEASNDNTIEFLDSSLGLENSNQMNTNN